MGVTLELSDVKNGVSHVCCCAVRGRAIVPNGDGNILDLHILIHLHNVDHKKWHITGVDAEIPCR